MIYTIENDKIKVAVSDLGAELQSIYGKSTNFEYLYQGKKGFWVGKSPILFPICGKLYNGEYTLDGKTYSIPLHGFAKKKVFALTKKTKTKIVLTLTEDKKTLKAYPFNFQLDVVYSVKGAKVNMELFVTNTGENTLPFNIGGHPGFNIPLDKGARFNDHYLKFSKKANTKAIVLTPLCYYSGKDEEYKLYKDKIINLRHNLFDNDAIFLCDMDKTVTLMSDKTDRYVKLSAPNATHIGFWHDPRRYAPYVCIEPWHGVPAVEGITDDFMTKLECIKLEKGEKYHYPIYMQFAE